MTKEQAIEKAKERYSEIWDCDINHPKYEDTVGEIVTGVIRLIVQPTSDDCVSREEALMALTGENLNTKSALELIALFNKRIQSLPPVTPTFPKGATNGDIIKAMFPNIEVNEIETNTGGYIDVKYLDTIRECDSMAFLRGWWNAPYKGVQNETD